MQPTSKMLSCCLLAHGISGIDGLPAVSGSLFGCIATYHAAPFAVGNEKRLCLKGIRFLR
jgi:hypothetical protein